MSPDLTQSQPVAIPDGVVVRTVERAVLGEFDTASPELLAERALLKRVDTKFLVPRELAVELLQGFERDFRIVLSQGATSASYETVYFDTPGLRLYHDHRRGRRPRSKVRIRHYVERDVCFLEVKTKNRYGVTEKVRVSREPRAFELTDDDRSLLAGLLDTHEPLVPMVRLLFPRVTLVGVATNERVTLDFGLHCHDDNGARTFPDVVIAEIKQPRFAARSPGMLVFRTLGIRPHRLSKYCVSVAALSGIAKTHRFRPALRALTRHAA